MKKEQGKVVKTTTIEETNKTKGKKNVKKPYVLSVKNVTMKFGSFVALNNVSFDIKKGESVGIIGANGAGKTTISEIIVGINKPTSGTMDYGFEYNKTHKEKVGMQFQDSSYPSGLTVKDIIRFARRLHGKTMSTADIKKMMNVFQMGGFYKRKARSLSGGQRQKLNIFLSVIHKPELVILDELSTGLDISARKDIIQFTKTLLKQNKIASILISHHMNEIKDICDRVIVLNKGEVMRIATIKEIEKESGSLDVYMENLISTSNKKDMKKVDYKL